MKKRIMSTLLALTMCLTLLPAAALATEGSGETVNQAKIGNNMYPTLLDAVNSIDQWTDEPVLIELLGDGFSGPAIGFDSDPARNYIIDFKGHTYTVTSALSGSTGYESQALRVTHNQKVELKNGTLTSPIALMMVHVYGGLTLDNMIIDGSNMPVNASDAYTVSYCSGSSVITGNTQIIAKSGGKAFDVDGDYNSKNKTVNVTFDEGFTGTVDGTIEYAHGTGLNAHLNIAGKGTFTNHSFNLLSVGNGQKANISITGGIFSDNVSDYIADGYEATDNSDGTYTVAKIPALSLTPDKATLPGGGTVTLTANRAVASVTCDDETITVTDTGDGLTWTAELPDTVKAYVFTAKASEAADAETANATVNVTKKSTSSGGSSVTTKTEKNDDGSTTTTKTNKVTGTVTETTTYPDGSKTTVETNKDGSSETTTRLADGTTANIATDADGNTETEVTVTDKAITDAEGEPVALPIPPVEEDNEVEINLPKAAKVEIPAEDVTPGTVAVIVNDDGTEEVVKTSIATPDGVIVPLDGSATVKLIDNSKDFIDTTNHWAEDEIDFAASHEIFNGTSANTFSPNAAMTRGMIAVVLHNFENNPEAVYDGSFDDVTSDAWYAEGVEWAAAKGIVDGYDNGSFGAEDDITREQLVTILYRYAKASGLAADEQGSLDGFSDADSVSDYAAEAMRWAVGTGLIKGDNLGHLNAKAGATRAEVAAVMARFCVNLSK